MYMDVDRVFYWLEGWHVEGHCAAAECGFVCSLFWCLGPRVQHHARSCVAVAVSAGVPYPGYYMTVLWLLWAGEV
jgi:hypothetical protein